MEYMEWGVMVNRFWRKPKQMLEKEKVGLVDSMLEKNKVVEEKLRKDRQWGIQSWPRDIRGQWWVMASRRCSGRWREQGGGSFLLIIQKIFFQEILGDWN